MVITGISERIKSLFDSEGGRVNIVLANLKIPEPTYYRSLKSGIWKLEHVANIAEYFNVTTDYLITGKQSESEHYKQTAEKFRKIIIDLLNGNDNTKGQEVISGQLNVGDGALSGVKQTP